MPISHCLEGKKEYREKIPTVRNKSASSIKFSRHTKHNQSTGNDITPFHEYDLFLIILKILVNVYTHSTWPKWLERYFIFLISSK